MVCLGQWVGAQAMWMVREKDFGYVDSQLGLVFSHGHRDLCPLSPGWTARQRIPSWSHSGVWLRGGPGVTLGVGGSSRPICTYQVGFLQSENKGEGGGQGKRKTSLSQFSFFKAMFCAFFLCYFLTLVLCRCWERGIALRQACYAWTLSWYDCVGSIPRASFPVCVLFGWY